MKPRPLFAFNDPILDDPERADEALKGFGDPHSSSAKTPVSKCDLIAGLGIDRHDAPIIATAERPASG